MTCEMLHFILILIVLLQNDVLGGMGGTPPSPAKTDVTILSDFGTKDPHKVC